jgi:cytochrome c oxidase cbb3-type subunit I/II
MEWIPDLWNAVLDDPADVGHKLFSTKLANFHFWIGTLGIIFYALPMYFSGFTQSLMWKQFSEQGILMYPNFLETVTQIIPMYMLRAIGGILYFTGGGYEL